MELKFKQQWWPNFTDEIRFAARNQDRSVVDSGWHYKSNKQIWPTLRMKYDISRR